MSQRVTMTVLRHTGPRTTSASLTRIRADHLRAERELQLQAQDQHHTQQAALTVEALLEAGSTFDTMDQFYDSESLMQRSDGSDGDMDGVAAWTSHSSALTRHGWCSSMGFPFFSPYTYFKGTATILHDGFPLLQPLHCISREQ
ncbi:hypothetical protein BD769DRAFT_1668471 [Suillus cothurnatus]|nr:hypothetical protein BD769DRAFT_1668471 [Suillus cothurnatus]